MWAEHASKHTPIYNQLAERVRLWLYPKIPIMINGTLCWASHKYARRQSLFYQTYTLNLKHTK